MATFSPSTQNLERRIRDYVAAGCGLEPRLVIQGNGNGPASQELYASVVLIHQDTRGIPHTLIKELEGGAGLCAGTMATVRDRYSVQWFRAGARDAARHFALWAYSPAGLAQATSTGVTVLRVSDVRQLDDVVSGAWEERAGLDLDIAYIQTIEQPIDHLETIPVEVSI